MINLLIAELEQLVTIYRAMLLVQTGNPIVDNAQNVIIEMMISDLNCFISDVKSHPIEYPFTPIGFRAHAVIH